MANVRYGWGYGPASDLSGPPASQSVNIVNSAQRDADKTLNAGQNQLAAAQASLQQTVRTLNNQRQLKAQGEQFRRFARPTYHV